MKLSDIGINNFYNEKVSYDNVFTLKQRYDDFIVKEIQEEGICDTGPIFVFSEIKESIDSIINLCNEFKIESELIKNTVEYYAENKDKLDLYSKEMSIDDLLNCTDLNLFNLKHDDIIEIGKFLILNKDKREELHKIVRKHPLMHSKTDQDKNIILYYGNDNRKIYSFVLKKMNKDTIQACSIISRALKLSHNDIKFAGNKDKRAVTFQKVTIKGCFFYDLVLLAKSYIQNNDYIKIFNIKQEVRHINLGELKGNRFEINIRCKDPKDIHLLNSLDFSRMQKGFINYYGQQRFGKSFNNHIVGEFILKNEYDKAMQCIMMIGDNDSGDLLEAKKHFLNKEFELSLNIIPSRYAIEKIICRGKVRNQSGKKIILSIKNESLKFYLHAYQSFNFNNEANHKISQGTTDLQEVYLDLKKENNKHLKGGTRKLIEKAENLHYRIMDEYASVVFDLSTSSYATIALREVIGDDVLFQ